MPEHHATTDDQGELPEAFAVNREGLPVNLFTLRQKLYLKAKREPAFRFYALYDRIYRRDVLWAAWVQVASNDGAPGVDGVTIAQIVNAPGGPELLVETLHRELRTKTYRPEAVLRVLIPKPDGRMRPLGIPTIRDRVVQTAAKLILEPIVEADFLDCSYGYRPARSAEDALRVIEQNVRAGYTAVYDADMQAYFDTIPHDKLMKGVERRIADRSVLHLLRLWLTAVVEERDEDGRPKHSRPHQGTPQGGVISPLLANLYLHWFDVVFHRRKGPGVWAKARLVRYADDFIIMARYISTPIIRWVEQTVEGWLGLTINRKKTRVIVLSPREGMSLDFSATPFGTTGIVMVDSGAISRPCRRSRRWRNIETNYGTSPVTTGLCAAAAAGSAGESVSAWLGGVLQLWASPWRVSRVECVYDRSTGEASASSEPAPLSTTGRDDFLQFLTRRLGLALL